MADLIDRSLRAAQHHNQRVLRNLEKKEHPSVRDEWLKNAIVTPFDQILSQPASAYRLPAHFSKIIPEQQLKVIRQGLVHLRQLNEDCVGFRYGDVQILLEGDADVAQLISDIYAFYEAVVPIRLARRNSRDRGDPYLQFQRVYDELLPALDQVLSIGASMHSCVLNSPQDYGAWLIYSNTWRELVTVTDYLDGTQNIQLRTAREHHQVCRDTIDLYGWGMDEDLQGVLDQVDVSDSTESIGSMVDELMRLAGEIRTMRPLLFHGHKPESVLFQIGSRIWVSWGWAIGAGIGIVHVDSTERALRAGLRRSSVRHVLRVQPDGLLFAMMAPWKKTIDLPKRRRALQVNLNLVREFHARLLAQYEQVDVDAILARYTQVEAAPIPLPAVDVSIDHVVAQGEDAALAALAISRGAPKADGGRRVTGLRLNRLAAALGTLGCTRRQGKGSEVLFYREGYKQARLGRHKQNPEVSPVAVRNALRRLGLTISDLIRVF